jgi:hypothetical protein
LLVPHRPLIPKGIDLQGPSAPAYHSMPAKTARALVAKLRALLKKPESEWGEEGAVPQTNNPSEYAVRALDAIAFVSRGSDQSLVVVDIQPEARLRTLQEGLSETDGHP